MGLQDFYERSYASEARGDDHSVVRPGRHPGDRFEAAVASMRHLFTGGAILELGAGSGLVARSLIAERVPFDRMVVTDFAAPRVANLRATLSDPRVEAAQFDVENPDRSLGQFDAVLMVALIEHLVDPMGAMTDLRTMLRPGGFVYIDTPNLAKWTRRIKLAAGRFPSTASTDEGLTRYDGRPADLYDEGHLHYFTFRSLERMSLKRCGFTRVERLPYRTLPGALGHNLARLRPTVFSEIAIAAYA